MKLQVGEIRMDAVSAESIPFPNKTRRFLLPCLKVYGKEFTRKLESVMKVAVGIGDMIVSKHTNFQWEKNIFILVNTYLARDHFVEFLEWIKEQPMYLEDYVYDNIQKTDLHMIVLKFPEKLYKSFENFMEGQYSQMFTQEEINELFKKHPEVKKVLVKDSNYKLTFVGELNKEWGTTIDPKEYDGELDTKPTDESEIFNHDI